MLIVAVQGCTDLGTETYVKTFATLIKKTFATLIKPEVVPGISTNTQIPGIEI